MKTIEEVAKEYSCRDDLTKLEFPINKELLCALEEIALKEGVRMAEEWISVEDELPPTLPYKEGIIENEDLLLLKHGQFQSLEFGVLRDSKKGKFWELPDRGVFKLKEITHWRPINRK